MHDLHGRDAQGRHIGQREKVGGEEKRALVCQQKGGKKIPLVSKNVFIAWL